MGLFSKSYDDDLYLAEDPFRKVSMPDVSIEDYFMLELDDKIVNRPVGLVNGKVKQGTDPMEFYTYEEADAHGALLVSTQQGFVYRIIKYSRLAF